MRRLDDLPPDQRAALSLLLREGNQYADVAALLRIRERAVHDRAHAALALLAPREARQLSAERREEIGDYLLGQSGGLADRLRTRTLLEGSPAAQAWARAVAEELAPLASAALPEIPNGAGPAEPAAAPVDPPEPGAGSQSAARTSAGAAPQASAPSPRESGTRSPARAAAQLPSSRVGGAILLGLIAAAVIVAIVLLSSGGGHSRTASRASSSGASASSTSGSASASSTPRATETKRLTLTPPNPASKALGVAAVLQEGAAYGFYLAAEKLPPSKGFFYAIWLYNSPSSHEPLSKSPPVGADGRLQGGALLPSNAGNYHQMIVTRETSERPASPGPVVLRGPFSLH